MTTPTRPCRVTGIIAIALTLATATGCATDTDGEVASLGKAGGTAEAKSVQRQGADAFYSCLTDASVPATIDVWDNGDAYVTIDAEKHDVMMLIPGQGGIMGAGKSGGDFSAADQAIWDEHSTNDTYLLMVDGTEHTDTLEQCHTDSGYADPGQQIDPAEELRNKQAVAEVTNKWIGCARENGLPTLEDVTAEADNYETFPDAVLPLSLTPDALRKLLEACPNFDEELAKRQQAPDFNWEKEYTPEPSIRIETPPDMTASPPAEAAPGDAPSVSPVTAHFDELTAILYEKAQAFWESQDSSNFAVASQAN
jgi:hypothetical protein